MNLNKIIRNELNILNGEIINENFFKSILLLREDIVGIGNLNIEEEDLLEIMRGYIEAALWTEAERLTAEYNDGNNFDDDDDRDEEETDLDRLIKVQSNMNKKSFTGFVQNDIDIDSRIQTYVDIKTFIKNIGIDTYNEAIAENDLFQFGMDLWLSRNGHGAGFFDHNYDNEKILMDNARKMKEVDLYLGDDYKLYFT
jgi:hypothetical protein